MNIRRKYEERTGRETVFALIPDLWEENKAFTEEYVEHLEKEIEKLNDIIEGRSFFLKRRDLKDAFRAGYMRRAYTYEKEHGGVEYWDEEPKEFNEWIKNK